MKKKTIASLLILCLTLSSSALIFGCANQSNLNENRENSRSEQGGGGTISGGLTVTGTGMFSIEELENMLIFARLLEMARSADDADSRIEELKELYLYDFSVGEIFELLAGDLEQFQDFYVPTFQFDGFELSSISVSASSRLPVINYWFVPVGWARQGFLSSRERIHIRFTDFRNTDITDVIAPMVGQRGIPVTEDGFWFDRMCVHGYNRFHMQIEGTQIRMSVDFPLGITGGDAAIEDFIRDWNMDLTGFTYDQIKSTKEAIEYLLDYEFIRDLARREFTPANIVSVDEMMAQRLRSRDVVATFNGMDGVTVSHFTYAEWITLSGTFENSASFTVPTGTTHVRVQGGDVSHTFALPIANDYPTVVLYIPVSAIGLSGVSVADGNVRIQQNGGSLSIPTPAVIIFPALGNDGEDLVMLASGDDDDLEFIVAP